MARKVVKLFYIGLSFQTTALQAVPLFHWAFVCFMLGWMFIILPSICFYIFLTREVIFLAEHSFVPDIAPLTANIFWYISFQAMLSQANETIHSESLPYQSCLIPGIPEDTQQTVRYATNYIIVPLYVLVAFLSFLSNGLVITVVIQARSLQNPPLLLLCNLSISDFLWALYTLFRATVLEQWPCYHCCDPGKISSESSSVTAVQSVNKWLSVGFVHPFQSHRKIYEWRFLPWKKDWDLGFFVVFRSNRW